MNAEHPQPPPQDESVPPDAEVLLDRALDAVEKNRRNGAVEVVLAILLSLATLASTWCGYQATLWSGVESDNRSASEQAHRQANENLILALQKRTYDLLEVREYWVALRNNDSHTAEMLLKHIRPQLREAILASLAAGILENPEVAGPMQRPEYNLPEEQDARRLRGEAAESNKAAQAANRNSMDYVAMTLMFASVLFFGGITSTFSSRFVRDGLGCVAVLILIIALINLLGLPVGKG